MNKAIFFLGAMAWIGLGLAAADDAKTGAIPLVADAGTVPLHHVDGSTSASVAGYIEKETACGPATPSATPVYSVAAGLAGLRQALLLEPPEFRSHDHAAQCLAPCGGNERSHDTTPIIGVPADNQRNPGGLLTFFPR